MTIAHTQYQIFLQNSLNTLQGIVFSFEKISQKGPSSICIREWNINPFHLDMKFNKTNTLSRQCYAVQPITTTFPSLFISLLPID
jgi:hypothetical protein